MTAVFISDVHLRSERDRGYEPILQFLDGLKKGIEHLFIVGDFFDFWFCGNGYLYPAFRRPIEKILELAGAGVKVRIFEGNHDFALSAYFVEKGIEVYPDWADVTLEGKRLLISHGDTVDRSNVRYLALRRVLRTGLFCRFQAVMPPSLLWKIASASSKISKGLTLESQEILVEKMDAFSKAKFAEGFDAVILGHCHRPVLRQYDVKGRTKTFVALGDWMDHFSCLVFERGYFRLSFNRD